MDFTGRKTWIGLALVAGLLAGCSSTSLTRAPVEERNVDAVAVATVDPSTLPGYENAGKPGYYTVRQGDTIMRIATEVNYPWRDIAAWNNLENPNVIEVGQVLRVVPPTAAGTGVTTPLTAGVEVPRAAEPAAAGATRPAIPVATQTTPEVAAAPAAAPAPAPLPPPPSAGADDVKFIWPARGAVIAGFNESTNKGVGIAGKAGDPVVAAADGRVVYAGAGLRGYGNLVILKHNDTFLTAYAHNQKLLVKEDQTVKKGDRIAEMGSTDADRVKLHFEIRRSGKPVDPLRYLPAR
ncbi:MAG TPA: peptidoglycan DD-metalloendopeptidase family protein [Ottowia sp.]|uniref:peptidoglycan DD-metalloendopeptidase family protein n=1 Tax=Ottowia sp. TaxID=1898956 RepID=UPI002B8D5F0B|nr:peptidoglycan DD-metalloendopeptidase family protein [Ottowia sp.]HMN22326.1 peptidoglycan DD-metalloendopeptidase family protein [Ottowia sp.]